jgi:5-methylcytosine-specific restriction enzyme B
MQEESAVAETALIASLGQRISDLRKQLIDRGQLRSEAFLQQCRDRFRERFGPDRLAQLDGLALLETMHLHGGTESLVYWLEFKNDDEMPAVFGSISGGSALKFGLYFSAEQDSWITGSPQNKKPISVDEAIEIARTHRDHLIAGVDELEKFPSEASDSDYSQLERSLEERATSVADTAWGHKYFSLLFPEKLDDYHATSFQRYMLIKCLQLPPKGDGRYVCAGRFQAMARELGMPMNHLSATLNEAFGQPYAYWLLNMTEEEWTALSPLGFVGMGWPLIPDLGSISYDQKSKNAVHALFAQHYPEEGKGGSLANQLFYFAARIQERDRVIVHAKNRVFGIARVTGPYEFDPSSSSPHRRPVDWLSLEDWSLPASEGKLSGFSVTKNRPLQLEVEQRTLSGVPVAPPPAKTTALSLTVPRPSPVLDGLAGRIQKVLERKGQVILYGPPGTGKTYWAERVAKDLASLSAFGARYTELPAEQQGVVFGKRDSTVRLCTFHPAYGYEDFLEGYRPVNQGGELTFELRPGIFKSMCSDASANPSHAYYLLVDEINRGDIPRIFGELLTVLELSKRGMPVTLPLSGDLLSVPRNLHVLGTMNTADRSIALLDTALRRRFGFVELMPDVQVLGATALSGVPLGPWLSALNGRIREHLGRDGRNLQIGHSYLMRGDRPLQSFAEFRRALRDDLLPLIEEYCYDDWEALESILGSGLVNAATLSFAEELFEEGREADLIQAVLAPSPAISTSATAAAAEAELEEVEVDAEAVDGADEPAS